MNWPSTGVALVICAENGSASPAPADLMPPLTSVTCQSAPAWGGNPSSFLPVEGSSGCLSPSRGDGSKLSSESSEPGSEIGDSGLGELAPGPAADVTKGSPTGAVTDRSSLDADGASSGGAVAALGIWIRSPAGG